MALKEAEEDVDISKVCIVVCSGEAASSEIIKSVLIEYVNVSSW